MLEVSLKDAARTCIGARLQLRLAREGVSHGGLGLLAKHRKRERLRALLDILRTLKTLVRTYIRALGNWLGSVRMQSVILFSFQITYVHYAAKN